MIREASKIDIPRMLLIARGSFEVVWSEASFEAEFQKDYSKVLVYETNDIITGYLIYWVLDNEGEIVSVAVEKKYRRKGIASDMLKHIFIKNPEVVKWFLEVDPKNKEAYELYRKHGFIKSRTIKDYYGQGKSAVVMQRT